MVMVKVFAKFISIPARDDDGDGEGIREVHINTSEGFWVGLRNFLRPFRGVNKVFFTSICRYSSMSA
jgi:hypothetical protein